MRTHFKAPAIVYLSNSHDRVPTVMLMTSGYVIAICCADEIEPNNADSFSCELAGTVVLVIICKILENHESIDTKRLTVVGCSRYGKAMGHAVFVSISNIY